MRLHIKIFRWSLVSSGMIALFWTIYYFAVGEIPITASVKIAPDWTIVLPVSMSRWWDILIGPIWTALILPFCKKMNEENPDLTDAMRLFAFCGSVAGLFIGLLFIGSDGSQTIIPLLKTGLIIVAIIILLFCLGGFIFCLSLGLTFFASFCIGVSLAAGLIIGLETGLGIILAVGTSVGFAAALIKLLTNKKLWGGLWKWLNNGNNCGEKATAT